MTNTLPQDDLRDPVAATRLIQHIRRLDSTVQAWAWLDEAAIFAAPQPCAARPLADEGSRTLGDGPLESEGPLAGVAIGVKDVIDVEGMPTCNGLSYAVAPPPAQADADCVARLRRAGAIPLGKTVTAETAYAFPGPTTNPWNAAHTPGGSSSGSAAAVACGMVPIALGTQTGGSIIRPAAYCGVVGFKPTRGRVSLSGVTPVSPSLDTLGWFTRDVEWAARVANVLLDADNGENAPCPLPDVAALRVAQLPALHTRPGDEALQTLSAACAELARAGSEVFTFEMEHEWKALTSAHRAVMVYEMARAIPKAITPTTLPVSTILEAIFKEGAGISQQDYADALADARTLASHLLKATAAFDIIVTPSAAGSAPPGLASTGDSTFNRIWTLLGWPTIHLPTGLCTKGLPLGVQLVGKPFADIELLGIARAVHPLIAKAPFADAAACALYTA